LQKDIGAVNALYPMPVTVVGLMNKDRVNFLAIAHVGIVELGTILVSISKFHEFSNQGIQENGVLSVNLVDQDMMKAADYCGLAKGAQTDKSGVFRYHFGEIAKAPVIDDAPVSMVCRVTDQYEAGNFINYILKPEHTYVREDLLDENGNIDYEKAGVILFEFRGKTYMSSGKVIGKAWSEGKDFRAPEK